MAYGTVTITGATYADTTVGGITYRTVTYTATNTFAAGDGVTVTGITPTTLNLPSTVGHQVATATGSNFTVIVATTDVTGTYSSGGSATNFYYDAGNHTNSNTFSITEGLPDAIGVPASVNANYANSKQVYDVAIAGQPFFVAASNKYPYRRITAQYKREQIDLTQSPGEQTLQGWWLRSQNSFHLGSGIKYQEPLQGQDVIYRFNKSAGVDPWTPGQVSLLPDVTQINSTSAATLMVGGVDTSVTPNVNVVVYADGSNLYRVTDGGTKTTINWTGTGTYTTILALATDGVNYYAANATGIYKGTLAGGNGASVFTHPTSVVGTVNNVVMGWVKQRLIAGINNYLFQIVPIVTHTVIATSLSNKIASLRVTPAHSLRIGDPITIAGLGTNYDGNKIVSEIPNTTTVNYFHDHIDVDYATPTGGTVVLSNNNTNPIYVHPITTWKFTGVCEGPSGIYISGYAGVSSNILKLDLDTNGAVPSLTSTSSAADFPDDEHVLSISMYLGAFMLIGTNYGIRVGKIDSSVYGKGYITYGPLTYKKTTVNDTVQNFAFVDRFAYATVTNDIDDLTGTSHSGLLRIDLSAALSDGKYGWAYDLNSGLTGTCSAIALLGTTGRMAFIVSNQGLYYQHATNKVASGYIDTGAVRYNTLENKHFKRVNVRLSSPVVGSVAISTILKNGAVNSLITVNTDAVADQDIGTQISSQGLDQLALRFTLNRSASDSTQGPLLNAYQLKSLIAMPRYRSIEIPVMNYDFEADRYNIATGYEGRAWDRLQVLESIESTGDSITFQDFTSGEQVECLIEQISFERMSSPDRRYKGYGGVVYVQVRTL